MKEIIIGGQLIRKSMEIKVASRVTKQEINQKPSCNNFVRRTSGLAIFKMITIH
jgi:hypothetical protein